MASIVAITVYRLAAFFAFSARLRAQELQPLKEYVTPQMATSVTASLISFVVIMILNVLYERVAIWITDFGELLSHGQILKVCRANFLSEDSQLQRCTVFINPNFSRKFWLWSWSNLRSFHISLTTTELPRTKTDYENSLTLKMFLFQFVNYYSSCFYIAFAKGKAVGYPGEPVYLLGKYRNEEVRCGFDQHLWPVYLLNLPSCHTWLLLGVVFFCSVILVVVWLSWQLNSLS